MLIENKNTICQALYNETQLDPFLAELIEINPILEEIQYLYSNLSTLMNENHVPISILNFPGRGYTIPEPLGTILIIGPYNYPILLTLKPLVGAIAAGF